MSTCAAWAAAVKRRDTETAEKNLETLIAPLRER
jgi:hypothetical protein